MARFLVLFGKVKMFDFISNNVKALLSICFVLYGGTVFPQDSTQIDWQEFYPLHVGDFWKYVIEWVQTGRIEIETKEVVAETTITNNRTYKKLLCINYSHGWRWSEYERVDSLGDVYGYYPIPGKEFLVWRLGIAVGESWWAEDSIRFLRLKEKDLRNVLGKRVIYLNFREYVFLEQGVVFDSVDVGIAQNFGVAYIGPSVEGGASVNLVGAVIKGKVYGDTTTVIVEDKENEEIIPKRFILYQNYPNPFNSSTHFRYALLKEGQATLKIFNLKGEVVKTLLNQDQKPGEYRVIWNGHDEGGEEVTSGIYFCQLRVGDQTQTIKLILIK